MSLKTSRKAGQAICIGSQIRITVIATRRGTVTLAIDAPNDYRIRYEVPGCSSDLLDAQDRATDQEP